MRDHRGIQLVIEAVTTNCLDVAGVGDSELVGKVVFGHCEEFSVEENEASVGRAGATAVIEYATQTSPIEEKKPGDAGIAMELANCLGEHWLSELALLHESLCLGETACIACVAVGDFNGVDHAVAVEEVVSGFGLKQWVGAVTKIDAIKRLGDGADDR